MASGYIKVFGFIFLVFGVGSAIFASLFNLF